MAVLTISRDTPNNLSIVRMTTSDALATVTSANYITKQMPTIMALNSGSWSWYVTDILAVSCSDQNAIVTFTNSSFSTVTQYGGGSGSGTVNAGLINQLAWYAANGNAVSGLNTANSAVLVTSAGGVPSLSTTLPNGLAMGTPASLVLTNATGLPVAGGGTGNSTFTAYSVICAGTTATGAFQNVVGVGTSGQVLTSNGAAALPTWQTASSGSGTVNSGTVNQLAWYAGTGTAVSGLATANSGVLVTSAGGVPSISTTLPSGLAMGTPASLVLTNATGLPVAGGGTGNSTFTAYSVICAGTTATGAFQNVSGVGTAGQVLTSNGAGALPTWQAGGGGSNPWSAGAGTGSAKGGDGTEVASGNYSLSYGTSTTTASGISSFAVGDGTTASGDYSTAFGKGCTAGGYGSFRSGQYCYGSGVESVAMGYNCGAQGTYSVAMGETCATSADNQFALGFGASPSKKGTFMWSDSGNHGNADTANDQFVITATGGYLYYQGTTLVHSIDSNANFITNKGEADQSYSLQTPSTGFSITIGAGVQRLILNPAGTLSAGTVVMPAAPINGQIEKISSTQTITTLTVSANAGQSIIAAPTTITAGGSFSMIYDLSITTWVPTA
jgi:hypothetical protein